ncbi:MAG: hypothetical protein IIW50_01110, partial [Alistipes sp.]|nr:hypothetical protein [Alistipes sp.]
KERQEQRQVASYKEKACSKFNYLIVDQAHYKLSSTIEYTKISQVTTNKPGKWHLLQSKGCCFFGYSWIKIGVSLKIFYI